MAKVIVYKYLFAEVNHGTEETSVMQQLFLDKTLTWSEANEEIAKKEAYNGEYTVLDDGVEEQTVPTQLDKIEAQVAYTAMMTDTLLEV